MHCWFPAGMKPASVIGWCAEPLWFALWREEVAAGRLELWSWVIKTKWSKINQRNSCDMNQKHEVAQQTIFCETQFCGDISAVLLTTVSDLPGWTDLKGGSWNQMGTMQYNKIKKSLECFLESSEKSLLRESPPVVQCVQWQTPTFHPAELSPSCWDWTYQTSASSFWDLLALLAGWLPWCWCQSASPLINLSLHSYVFQTSSGPEEGGADH